MANAILNFHFDYWHTSLRLSVKIAVFNVRLLYKVNMVYWIHSLFFVKYGVKSYVFLLILQLLTSSSIPIDG